MRNIVLVSLSKYIKKNEIAETRSQIFCGLYKQHTPFVNCATHNIWGQTTDLQKFYLQMEIYEK
jgi:hypothetical protein